MSKHEQLKENAEDAVTRLFSDDSVPREIAEESLEELVSMIDDFLNALRDD